MPVDLVAEVIANRRMNDEYNVLALAAEPIARRAAPGQFVMVKAGTSHDPLLRRPFSVFEVLRDAAGAPTGISLLNKRVGPSTRRLFDAEPGQRVACMGPLGRPFAAIDPPVEAWLVAGGVGLAPFATLAETLRGRHVHVTLFYGARRGAELLYLDHFRALGLSLVLTTEDGSVGERGRVVAPLDRQLAGRPRSAPVMLYACGPEGMLAAVAASATRHGRPCQVSVERIMGCGLGGCYSCVVPMRTEGDHVHHVRACIAGPVLPADQIVWDETR